LIAATNHPQLLDRAMFRRFDSVIEYPLPTGDIVKALIRNRLATIRLERIGWQAVAKAAEGLSHAEITLAAERAAKDAILSKSDVVTTMALVASLRERQRVSSR
jgi:AAA+ superfamily predicted ATPase